jgi:CHAD domain-containing protein
VAKAWEVPGLEGRAIFRDAAGRVILTRWREMMSYREGTLLGEDIEELHAMRVASRRLRAAMDAFEAAFPSRSFRRYLKRVKQVTDTLGAARDLDVAIAGLEEREASMSELERPGLEGLIARYRAERATETEHIARLFRELDETGFAERFEAYVARHTGIEVERLHPVPPGGR